MDSVMLAFRKIPRKLLFKLGTNEEWTAAKGRPRVYGQKIDVSVQHAQISVLAALERAERRVVRLG